MPASPLDHHVQVHQYIRRHGRRPAGHELDGGSPSGPVRLLLLARLRRRIALVLARL